MNFTQGPRQWEGILPDCELQYQQNTAYYASGKSKIQRNCEFLSNNVIDIHGTNTMNILQYLYLNGEYRTIF